MGDGRLHYFISNKARKLHHQRIKPVKLTWTTAWRRFNKKLKVDEANKKRSRKTVRVQKSIVGMNIAEINRKKQESRNDRDKLHDAAIAEVKQRKTAEIKKKQEERAKIAKQQPKGGAPKQPK